MRRRPIIAALAVLVAAACTAQAAEPSDPFARVYDTGRPSATAIDGSALAVRDGWTQIPEGTGAHDFAGDAVLINDRLAAVIRREAGGADVYARATDGWVRRATVHIANELGAVTIAEVGAGAAAVECGALLRLATGDATLQIVPGPGTQRLRIETDARYVVVPDLLAYDVVYEPALPGSGAVGLPVDNRFLSLARGGDAMVMCVWQSSEREVDLVPGGCEVECAEGEPVWVAVIEGKGIWHASDAAGAWTPPFAAKWRVDRVRDDGVAESELIEGDEVPGPGGDRLTVIYPADRSRQTPLNVICPTDVMRGAIGLGPCRYVLAAEGLDATGRTSPPDVANWVERVFKRKRQARQADAIKERLDGMVDHVLHGERAVRRYAQMAARMRTDCEAAEQDEVTVELLRAVADMEHALAERSVAHAADAAAQIIAATALPDQADGVPELCAELRAMGDEQDHTLARCRMGARRVTATCRTALQQERGDAELLKSLMALADKTLKSGATTLVNKAPEGD